MGQPYSMIRFRSEDSVKAYIEGLAIGIPVYRTAEFECDDGPMPEEYVAVLARESTPAVPDAPTGAQVRGNRIVSVSVTVHTRAEKTLDADGNPIRTARERHIYLFGLVMEAFMQEDLKDLLNRNAEQFGVGFYDAEVMGDQSLPVTRAYQSQIDMMLTAVSL